MFKKKKKKGFTLVELLAVIVILAVVILIAVTAVIPRMNKAKKNAFIDEALIYLKAAKEAYAFDDENIGSSCINITDLNDNYVKKSGDNYIGTITTELTNGDYVQTISLTNGKYYLVSSSTNMSADDVKSSMPQGFKSSCGNNNSIVAQCLTDDSSCSLPVSLDGYSSVEVTRTGKNLFNPNSINTEWVNANGTISLVPTAKSIRISVVAGQSLAISNSNASSGTNILLIAFFDTNGSMLSRNVEYGGAKYKIATAPSNTAYAIASFYTWSETANQQLEFNSVATAFEPYNGTTEIIPLGQTVYGGSIDLTTGMLTVTHVKQVYRGDDLDTLSLSYGQTASGYTHMYFGINNTPLGKNYGQQLHTKSNMGVITNAQTSAIPSSEGFAVLNITNPDRLIVYWYVNLTWASANDFKTWLNNNPFELYYQLDTPQTYQLTNISTSN